MSELPDTSKTTSNEDAGILASAASESSSKVRKIFLFSVVVEKLYFFFH